MNLFNETLEQLETNVGFIPPNPPKLSNAYNNYWLDDLYLDTAVFNDIAGNTDKLTLQDFKNQAALITEEARELVEALDANDPVEVLDAAVDIAVVLSGLISKLVSLGFDVSEAMEATAENNLSKFPSTIMSHLIDDTRVKYELKGVTTDLTVKDGRYIFKNILTGKVLKPSNYVDNDLSKFVPVGFSFANNQ